MAPLPSEDAEQHVRRMTKIAWENGAYVAAKPLREALGCIYDMTEGYADGAPDASPHDKLCNEIADIARHLRPEPKKGGAE
jgi:hypothetical protein